MKHSKTSIAKELNLTTRFPEGSSVFVPTGSVFTSIAQLPTIPSKSIGIPEKHTWGLYKGQHDTDVRSVKRKSEVIDYDNLHESNEDMNEDELQFYLEMTTDNSIDVIGAEKDSTIDQEKQKKTRQNKSPDAVSAIEHNLRLFSLPAKPGDALETLTLKKAV